MIFERIREEYIGIDMKKDSDNDGIPDKIEKIGMRNQYGKVIRTNPDKADTDDDGISDGMEMGEIVVDDKVTQVDQKHHLNKYVYFQMITDPTVYDENIVYNPRASLELSAQILEDKEKINMKTSVLNSATQVSVDKDGTNTINDLKDIELSYEIPECMTIDKKIIKLGNIKNMNKKEIEERITHNSQNCNGKKHIITVKLIGKNIKTIEKEIRINGLYWYENLAEGEADTPIIRLIEKVRAYASTYDENKIEEVLSNNALTQEEKADFWRQERENYKLRWRLIYLCNDDIYVAHHFREYMENQNLLQHGVFNMSKLVFNDGVVNTITQNPEQERYKKMLLDYIENTMQDRQEQYQIEELLKGYDDIIKTYGGLVEELQSQERNIKVECKTAIDTINKNLEYLNGSDKTVEGIGQRIESIVGEGEVLKRNNIKVNVTNKINSNALKPLEEEYNRLSGINKAVSKAGIVISVTSDVVEMFNNITEITTIAQTYTDYERFLELIINETKYPALRNAAEELQKELKDQYKLYINESYKFIEKTGIATLTSAMETEIAQFCGGVSKLMGQVGLTATITKLALNATLGIDDLLENAVYVIGASEIADILSEQMVICSKEFDKNYNVSHKNAYESAEKFRYYYIELQQMRIYEEKKYLEMKGMNGALDIFGTSIKKWNKYSTAQTICNGTIEEIGKMKF